MAAEWPWDVPSNGGQEEGAGSGWAWLYPPTSFSLRLHLEVTYVNSQILSSLIQNRMPLSLLHLGNGPWAVPHLRPPFV